MVNVRRNLYSFRRCWIWSSCICCDLHGLYDSPLSNLLSWVSRFAMLEMLRMPRALRLSAFLIFFPFHASISLFAPPPPLSLFFSSPLPLFLSLYISLSPGRSVSLSLPLSLSIRAPRYLFYLVLKTVQVRKPGVKETLQADLGFLYVASKCV